MMRAKKNFHKNPKTRDFMISTSKGVIRGVKRSFPSDGSCELCHHKPSKKLDYHHWDDAKPIRGMWVCGFCHSHIHRFEQGLPFKSGRFSWKDYLPAYIELKKAIDSGKNLMTGSRKKQLSEHQKIMANAIEGVRA